MQEPSQGSSVTGDERVNPDSPPSAGEIEAQLQRILASKIFQKAHRHSLFLAFVVRKALSGQRDEIKEQVIALEVFGRPDHDPSTDSNVRAEARRLRDRLDEYYRGSGLHDPVEIDLPKGGYVPTFSRRSEGSATRTSAESIPQGAASSAASPGLRMSRRWKWAVAGVALAAIAAVTLDSWQRHVRNVRLTAAGTTSWEALKLYQDGIETQNSRGDKYSITYLNRAIESDPKFALAYAALGMVYRDMGEQDLADANFTKAFELRSGTTGAANFRIQAFYYSYVTGELHTANQFYQLWAEHYPHDAVPRANWAINCNFLGEYDKAVRETVEAMRIGAPEGPAYGNLVGYYTSVKELVKARETYDRALAKGLDGLALRGNRYGVAFLEKKQDIMDNLLNWASSDPDANNLLFSLQSDTEAFYGRLHKAREFSELARQAAERGGDDESAALRLLNAALHEVEFGNPELARTLSTQALARAPSANVQIIAAVVLARARDTVTASKLADDLEKRYPLNTMLKGYWLPTIRSANELSNAPDKALQILQEASSYELGQPDPSVGVGGLIYPAYIRGEAYLKLGKGAEAAAEFQKLIDQWGVAQNSPLGALSRLGVARAYAVSGDTAAAKNAYQDFLALWKDADPDVPILIQAKAEYAKLR